MTSSMRWRQDGDERIWHEVMFAFVVHCTAQFATACAGREGRAMDSMVDFCVKPRLSWNSFFDCMFEESEGLGKQKERHF